MRIMEIQNDCLTYVFAYYTNVTPHPRDLPYVVYGKACEDRPHASPFSMKTPPMLLGGDKGRHIRFAPSLFGPKV